MNWTERIAAAKTNGGFTEADIRLASDWVTCACGEQDLRIRRDFCGAPLDLELADYGRRFGYAVANHTPNSAAILLAKIETRTAQVLSDFGGKTMNRDKTTKHALHFDPVG